jgi:hypothetical protein
MKITQDVREYAESLGMAPEKALEEGMREKAVAFKEGGQHLYVAGDTVAAVAAAADAVVAGPQEP